MLLYKIRLATIPIQRLPGRPLQCKDVDMEETPASTFAIDLPTVPISCFGKIDIIADKMFLTNSNDVE